MKKLIRSSFIVLAMVVTAPAFSGLSFAEDGILMIHVEDVDEKPVKGIVFVNKDNGVHSDPTDSAGTARLALSKAVQPNGWIHLLVLNETNDNDNWILISPWDERVAVPPFDNKANRFVPVVVAKKCDKRLLANPLALRAMAATANSELAPKGANEKIIEEQRRAVMAEVARAYGLGTDEIDRAIRAWSEKSKDPYEIGLAALYARNYPLASEQLTKSLEIKEAELEKKKAEVANTAFFLGQAFYEQGKYREAANALREAMAQRPDDATIINNLAMSLTEAGSYAEAELLLMRALEIKEKVLGADHPDLATSLNNLARLYYKQGKYAEAEPLFKRALAIWEKPLGAAPPNMAFSLKGLAELYRDQGKYAEAEPFFKQALAICEKALGADHPDVAVVLNDYAALLRKLNRESEAAAMETRAREIRARHAQKNPKN